MDYSSAVPIVLSLIVVVVTCLAWTWWTSENEERKKRAQKKSEKAGSILEEITERERQRRRKLEEEVEQIRKLKLEKQQEIEELASIKAEEKAKVREQQEVEQKLADEKKEKEDEQVRAVKAAVAAAHKQGVLCSFANASLEEEAREAPLELRIRLSDSVGFPTRVHHIKSRLKSDYPGQPSEPRQRILHRGEVVGDHAKLLDLFTAHEPKTSPLPFILVVGEDKKAEPEIVDMAKQIESTSETQPVRRKRELAPSDQIRVTIKPAVDVEDVVSLQMKLGSSIAEVKAAHVRASRSTFAQLIFGGRVLQDDDTLISLVATCLDKRNITLLASNGK